MAPVDSPLAAPPRRPTVALVGNPNTGKTTLFNALTGLHQRVGNYPGVTVETKKGRFSCRGETFQVIDLPGTYSLAPRSPDEMVAVNVLLGRQTGEPRPDVVVSIVDASNLERNLYLTTQALEMGLPVVIALNMVDIAASHGLEIDVALLRQRFGVPIVPIQANKHRGLDDLKQAIAGAALAEGSHPRRDLPRPTFPLAFEQEVASLARDLGEQVPRFLVRRLVLDIGGHTERCLSHEAGPGLSEKVAAVRRRLALADCAVPGIEARTRYGWIRQTAAGCIHRPECRPVTWTDRLDRLLTHRLWGTLVFVGVMFLVFQSIFTWAGPVMDVLKSAKDTLAETLRDRLPPGPLTSLVTDGVLEGVGSVLVFLPQIVILFAFIALLEDCGYMARAAFVMDRLMARCGLSGKSFIPLLSSVACAVPGVMAARVIENRRDRLATILVAPLMSCSARLPVYVLLIGAFLTAGYPRWLPGVALFGMYSIGLVAAPLVALLLKRTLLRGETPAFVMEMPVYKWPSVRTVLRRVIDSAWAFVRRAGTLILASMVVIWALLYFPHGDGTGGAYDVRIAQLRADAARLRTERPSLPPAEMEEAITRKGEEAVRLDGEWKRQSILGRLGQALEPVVRPLGWDWKVGTAALASFPAREVVVGTLGMLYNAGKVEADDIRQADNVGNTPLARVLQDARWQDDPSRKVFSVPVALSVMVFFALCCQCASTLAVIRRETGGWRWPVFTFTYMTTLAYIGAMAVYQIGSRV